MCSYRMSIRCENNSETKSENCYCAKNKKEPQFILVISMYRRGLIIYVEWGGIRELENYVHKKG